MHILLERSYGLNATMNTEAVCQMIIETIEYSPRPFYINFYPQHFTNMDIQSCDIWKQDRINQEALYMNVCMKFQSLIKILHMTCQNLFEITPNLSTDLLFNEVLFGFTHPLRICLIFRKKYHKGSRFIPLVVLGTCNNCIKSDVTDSKRIHLLLVLLSITPSGRWVGQRVLSRVLFSL